MKPSFNGLTDPGLVRTVNQDAYYIDPEGRFFILADGMGGHAGGQEASRIATESIREHLEKHWLSEQKSEVLLKEAIYLANGKILEDQVTHPQRREMGTTLVILIFRLEETWIAHIGDSRIYRLRDSQLEQLTEDHTWIARAMRDGDLSKEEARAHPYRHVLSQCLGRKDINQMDIKSIDSQSGDRYLLCSDGLTEEVPDELIMESVKSSSSCEDATAILVDEAKKGGGSDNITVILVAQE